MQYIVGYQALHQALDGWRTQNRTRCLDQRGRLGLTEHWVRGQRAFDPSEVAVLRERIRRNDPTLPRQRGTIE